MFGKFVKLSWSALLILSFISACADFAGEDGALDNGSREKVINGTPEAGEPSAVGTMK